jgi:ribosomal protein S18 acetylase RimI-like enzyme
MAATTTPAGLRLRAMTEADVPAADSLRALAGWNQTLQDWRRFIACAPDGCFVAEKDGAVVGTATTISYATDLSWIGMVLVHPDQRRHGIGTLLLQHCREHLGGRGVRCIKLDATPLGKVVYDRLGFRDEWTLTRWETKSGIVAPAGDDRAVALTQAREGRRAGVLNIEGRQNAVPPVGSVRSLAPSDWNAIIRLDRQIFGVNREQLLRLLAGQSRHALVAEDAAGSPAGFGMLRDGARALYLGPVVANVPAAGMALAQTLVHEAAGQPVFWDVPDMNHEAVNLANQLGFTPQRTLVRMFLGENSNPGQPALQFAIVAPEVG